ncbi:MAG: TAXI family TRAP transporter solute-binding subunit [Synergistaceae bacterium]|jgi:TRAP transporter TAXI family solute receptor|nr:TAXI family TRAP transporter solute-binding subunit [Synergistaceae bacterium]
MCRKKMVAVVLLACVFAMLSCSSVMAAPQRLIIATAGVSGSYYPFGGALAKIWTSKLKDKVSVAAQATGGAIENTKLMEGGEVELALTQNDLADYSWKQQHMFTKEYRKQRAIATLFPEVIHIFSLRSSGADNIAALKGKRISMSQQGSGGLINSQQIFSHYGFSEKDVQPFYLSNVDAVDRMKDDLLDAIFVTTGAPNATYQDLCFAKDVAILGMSDADVAAITKQYPFYQKYVIPQTDYAKQKGDVQTVAVQAILIASEDLDDELVYQMTKTLWESREELITAMAKASYMDPQNPLKSVTIPIHKGAEKYYREKGLIK